MFNLPFGFGGYEDGIGGGGNSGGDPTGGTGGGIGAGNTGPRQLTTDDWLKMIMSGYKQPGRNGVGWGGIGPAMAFMGLPNMAGGSHRNGQYGGLHGILAAFLANGGLGNGPPNGSGNGNGNGNGGGGGGIGGGGGGGGNGNGNGGGPFQEPNFLVAPPIGTGVQWRRTMR